MSPAWQAAPSISGKFFTTESHGKPLGWLILTKFQWNDEEKTTNWKKSWVGKEQRSAFTMWVQSLSDV